MDSKLLQQPRPGAVAPTHQDANNEEQPEIETPETEMPAFRELAVEAAQPPVRLKLDPPIDYDGKQYHEIIADFDKLIGKDFQRCEREFQHQYKADRNETPLPEMKHLYHCIVISHAADVPLGLVFKLPRRYYTPLRLEALKACGSSPEAESP
jgi:hypothetical protein